MAPRLPNSQTVVCLGCGPSLTQADVDACRGKALVVAINDAHLLAPWADVLYACDVAWWDYYKGVPSFHGLKFAMQAPPGRRRGQIAGAGWPGWPGVTVMKNAGRTGLATDPSGLMTGLNSGYQAINLAVHFGARRVLLLGYDMQVTDKGHFFGDHPPQLRQDSPYVRFRRLFETIVDPLKAAGVEVINCSRETALDCFPRMTLDEALAACEVAA